MKLDNSIKVYYSLGVDMTSFAKESISRYLKLPFNEVGFFDIENGFELLYDRENEGIVRITFSDLKGLHLLIEATNAFDVVDVYNLIITGINEWNKKKYVYSS